MMDSRESASAITPARYVFADVVVDAHAHQLTRAGHAVALEPKAYAVLLDLLDHPGQLRSRDEIMDAVWGHGFVTPGTLSRLVMQLRRALGDDSGQPQYIQTVHGLGYRFIASLQPATADAAPKLRFAPPPHARLPRRAAPLIGRERAIDELAQQLREQPLVTLLGAGGIGKTQLALEVARQAVADYPDGVWLFDCSAAIDNDTLLRDLAGLFDIRATHGTDELPARLGELLRTRDLLLVIDNAERVADALGQLADTLLAGCAQLHLLVTSQHRLNCSGETLFRLTPLDVPADDAWDTDAAVAQLAQVPSVSLLLARSRAIASSFTVTPDNASAVAAICRQLDGLPLALEIAAAGLRLLSPEQLLQRMHDRLLNLAEAVPSRPAHHQTLHALIEWSYALLPAPEQTLLRALAVFAGPCTLGGAVAVGAVFGMNDGQVLERLGNLIDKSLLTVDVGTNPPHYRLLDSVRRFALLRLAETGDEARVRDAHLDHFVWFTARVEAEIQGEHQAWWADRVKREWGNLQAALGHALTHATRAESALALAANLGWYFRIGTDYAEATRWLERALELPTAATRHRAMALVALGIVLHHAAVHDRAGTYLRVGIAMAQQLGESRLAGIGEAILAGELAMCGDYAGAETSGLAALALAQALNDNLLRSAGLLSHGIALGLREQHRAAAACMDEACTLVSASGGARFQQAYVLINLALQRHYQGDAHGAARDWRQALELFTSLQHWRGAAGCVEGAAYLASAGGNAARAARFLAAAAQVRRLSSGPLFPHWEKAHRQVEHATRDALREDYDAAWRAGTGARFEVIADEARAVLETLAETHPRSGASNPSGS